MPELHSVTGAKRLEAVLRGWIADGSLLPGQRLPSEQEFTADFEISRSTVRLVMIRLSAEGLIRGEHGRGYFVRDRRDRRRDPGRHR